MQKPYPQSIKRYNIYAIFSKIYMKEIFLVMYHNRIAIFILYYIHVSEHIGKLTLVTICSEIFVFELNDGAETVFYVMSALGVMFQS